MIENALLLIELLCFGLIIETIIVFTLILFIIKLSNN
jgi:hypothetical protein